jgi:hypothetical protein
MGALQTAARLLSGIDALLGGGSSIHIPPAVESHAGMVSEGNSSVEQRKLYGLLRALYWNNGLYLDRAAEWHAAGLSGPEVRELRTMQAALVEFYVANVMPGPLPAALPIEFAPLSALLEGTEVGRLLEQRRDVVVDRIEDVWGWSNWQTNKQVYIRHLAMLGNAYLYIGTRTVGEPEPSTRSAAQRVYMQVLPPEHVTDEDQDERGFLTYARMDIPRLERLRDGSVRSYWSTHVWDKHRDAYRYYESENTPQFASGLLGNPKVDETMTGTYGIDFVPLAHAAFRNVGGLYGAAPITPVLTKVDELNLKATRLAQLLFRHGRADMVLEGVGGSIDGMWTPPPRPSAGDATEVTIDGESFWTVPPGYSLKHLIAALNYDAHRGSIKDDYDHVADTDLPELRYYTIGQSGNASGRALRTMLAPAVSRVEEVRGNAESALTRGHMMALTIGQRTNVPGFEKERIGTYEDRTFEHGIAERDVIPASANEKEATALNRANVFKVYFDATGDMEAAAELAGLTDDEKAVLLKGITPLGLMPDVTAITSPVEGDQDGIL